VKGKEDRKGEEVLLKGSAPQITQDSQNLLLPTELDDATGHMAGDQGGHAISSVHGGVSRCVQRTEAHGDFFLRCSQLPGSLNQRSLTLETAVWTSCLWFSMVAKMMSDWYT
jgi:hypothetical protein